MNEESSGPQELWSGANKHSKDAMGFASLDGVLMDVNDSFCRLSGYSKEELIDKRRYQDLTPVECHEYEARVVETILGTGEIAEYETEYIRKDGSRVPVLLTTFVVKEYGRHPIGIAAIVKDISEHKQVEERLREREQMYRELADSLPQAVFELHPSGIISSANSAAFRTFGYTQEDLAEGMNVTQMMIDEDRDRARGRIQRVLNGEEEEGPAEYTGQRKDGGTFPVLVYSSPMMKDNRIVGLRGIAVDITGRKRNEQMVQESQRRYQDIFSYASDAIIIRDLEGNIVETNHSAATLTGYTLEELTKTNISQLLSNDSLRLAMESQNVLLKGKATSRRYELELIRKDGSRKSVESITGLVTKDGQPVGIQAMVRDITEQRQLRENMQFYISEITRAQEEERRRIARELHDETAQSLAALLLDIQAVGRAGQRLSDDTLERLEQLRVKANSILEGVRRFSHELRPDVLDRMGLLPALEMLATELNREDAARTHIEVTGYERRLRPEVELVLFRIAQEAMRNVRKHSRATEAVIIVEFTPNTVRLTVADNGRGFEPPGAVNGLAGKGKLGLIGMQERARLLGGSLSVISHPGKGTTVVVEIGA